MIPERPRLARVVFDESHSEAWTIRPEVASAIQPAHPADSSLARAAATLAERDFEVAAHTDGPLTSEVLAGADVLVIAHPSDPKWEATVDGGSPVLAPEELEAIDAFVRRGGGLIVLGETEQDKYGNNLNELLGRFGLRIENATVQDYDHHHGDAPAWVDAELDRRPVPASTEDSATPDVLARVERACFYRTGTLAIGLANRARAIARTRETASTPGAPLAVVTPHGAGRVAALADSDLFGDDCISDLDHEELWLNLVYWAAQPAFTGSGPTTASPGSADPAWMRLRQTVDELRLLQEPDGSVDTSEARRRQAPGSGRVDQRVGVRPQAPLPAPKRLHQRPHRRSRLLGHGRLRKAGLRPLGRGLPSRARAPRRDRASMRVSDVQAKRLSRHLLRGADRAGAVARVGRRARARALRQRQVRPGQPGRLHGRLCVRVRGALPRDLLHRRAPALSLRGDLLRSGGGALPSRLRRRGRVAAPQPAARRRLPADLAAALPGRLHALGPGPRPHPHARRSALRPVHDPPAQPVLDVLARGAALRPDHLRRGGDAGAGGLRLRPLRPVRDPLRPSLPLPDHRQPGAQLRRPRGPAAVRLPAPGGIPALDRQPAARSTGIASPTGSRRFASASRTSTTRGSTGPSSRNGSPPTIWSPRTSRRPRPRCGHATGAISPRSTSRRSSSTWSATTSSRSASSTSSCSRSSSLRSTRRRPPGRR